MSGFLSPALLSTTTYAIPTAAQSTAMFAGSAIPASAATSAAGATSAANAAANAAALSQRAANLDAFVKGLGAVGGIVSAGVSGAAALKGTAKPSDPYKRQRELERRLIAQRAGQREGGISSTRKTGPLGDPTTAPTGKRTLLGG